MKRIFALLLSLVLLAPAGAGFADGETVILRSAADWAAFAQNCTLDSWSAGKQILLAQDLVLSAEESVPVPLFAGVFDGGGHTISFALTGALSPAGLFRLILPDGTVKNLAVSGTVVPAGAAEAVGGLAGENRGRIENCAFSGGVTGGRAVGGIVGRNAESGTVLRCTALLQDGAEIRGEHAVGGIAGENLGTISGCVNHANVNTSAPGYVAPELPDLASLSLEPEEIVDITDIGGIAGFSAGSAADCENDGTVGYPSVGYNVGGVIGRQSGCTERCSNSGTVYGRKDVGGIVGQLAPDTRWNFSGSRLEELRAELTALRAELDALGDDAAAQKRAVSDDLSALLNAMERAGTAAEAFADAAADWADGSLATLNEFSARISALAADLVPVSRELSELTERLPAIASQLSAASDSMADASANTRSGLALLANAVRAANTAAVDMLAAVRQAGESVKTLTETILADPSSAALAVDTARTEIRRALLPVQWDVQTASDDLALALDALSGVSGSLSDGFTLLSDASSSAAKALETLHRASALTESLLEALSAQETLAFPTLRGQSDARGELFNALHTVGDAAETLRANLDGAALEGDLRAVTDRLFTLSDLLLSLADESEEISEPDYAADISGTGVREHANGMIIACSNRGPVAADTNTGGIVGAVTLELAFDREDTLNLSSLLTGGAKYLIYAVLSQCESTGGISAKKEAAGGVAGRMDYGAAFDCRASGSVRSGGSYAGGVAGLCSGTLRRCQARAILSAGDYMGGIVGQGHDLYSCLVIPYFESVVSYQGAVAGDADGVLSDNCYADCALGAVNGFSFAGRAEPVAYETLLARAGDGDLFRSAAVRFLLPDGSAAVRTVPYGGSLDTLPVCTDPDGLRSWVWDAFGAERVTHDRTVEGRWLDPIPTLASAEEPPLFLAEGAFARGELLRVTAEDTAEGTGWRLHIVNENGERVSPGTVLTVHLRAEAGGTLYVDRVRTAYAADGSYLVFPAAEGALCVYVPAAAKRSAALWAALGGAGALALGAAAYGTFRRRKVRAKQSAAQQ